MKNALSITAACDIPLVADGVPSERLIEWTVEAARATITAPSQRPPLNLALVIDRSGSMGDGAKLAYAVRTACFVLDQLADGDRAAIVAFDDEVGLLAPSTPIDEARRREMKAAVRALAPRGRTDLHGGWLRGAAEAAECLLPGGVNRVLLLTDGLANRGLTDIEPIVAQVRGLHQRGVSTSTFGVGIDYDEHLLRPMAEHGGGHYEYIADPDQIPQAIARELGELLSVVARGVRLEVRWPRGVAVNLLGDLPHDAQDRTLSVPLGDLSSCSERRLYTRVLTPPAPAGDLKAVRGRLWWIGLDGAEESVAADVEFRYATAEEAEAAPTDAELQQRAGRVDLEAAASRAMQLEKAGDRAGARRALHLALQARRAHLTDADAAEYEALAAEIRAGLQPEQRKQRDATAYRMRNTRP